jgi:hypothetical protein
MTKTTSLSCVMAAMLLTFGVVAAADDVAAVNAEAQHAKPTATNTPENQSKPQQEETTQANSSPSNAAKPQEEPDCNN